MVDEAHRLKKELLLFKVDFEKAFDSVDRHYLNIVMHKMNFRRLCRKWIMECVTTTSSSILVTDEFQLNEDFAKVTPFHRLDS
jgi:hypothetical protein